MKNATQLYTKDKISYWHGHGDSISIADHLIDNKFCVNGWFKKKVFNVMIWLMNKLDVRSIHLANIPREMVTKSYNITQIQIEELIKKYKIDLEYIWRENPKYLIMGQNVFQELFNEPSLHFSSIDTEFRYNVARPSYDDFNDYNNRKFGYEVNVAFWGFKILIVPWIDGCFLLPSI